MNKESKNTLVPKLRFPEFRGAEGWEETKLRNHIDLFSGYAFQSVFFSNTGKKLLTPKNFTKNGYSNFTEDNTKFTIENYDTNLICKEGDLMLLLTDLTSSCELLGRPLYLRKEDGIVLLNQRIVRVIKTGNIQIPFLFHYFSTDSYLKRIKNTASGSTVKHSSNKIILDTNIFFPSEREQIKIADCLSSLDDVIEAENKKLETLKVLKKGMMQQLFPAEGETVPKVRFPEFKGTQEWELCYLGKIAENLDYKRIPITENNRVKGDIPYYGASGIIDYVNDFIYDENLLCISEDGANLIARTYPIAFSISGKTWVNNHAHVLKFEKEYTQIIVQNYLNAVNLESYLTGMAQPKLNRAKLDSILIPIPENPDEQKKIADCLSSIDDLITAQSKKNESLKSHKKGLMQQLFPTLKD